ncbi:TPT domain-containing protein [Mycena venus]|uniref:TPT domain-containing protein n=1 Tax=Mycena venus TaxID=2733690 RepID=A0A8H6Z200_9AGAR|nr:TPT domain-containing protein [Mycena venus]
MHVVLSKVVTATAKHSVIGISYFGNLFMAIGLLPFIFLNGEVDALHRRLISPDQVWMPFIVGTAVTGIFGFFLGIANVLSIKVTSPISHMFSAAAKSVIQMMLGVFFFGDIITTYRLGAITLITGGTMFYTWTQSNARSETVLAPKNDLERQNQNSELEQPLLQGEKSNEKASTVL